MKFLIPSYKRPEAITAHKPLLEGGIPGEQIFISTQREEDYAAYSARYGALVNVIYRPKVNVAGNRNNLFEHLALGERAVFLDDDWTGVSECVAKEGKAHGSTRRLPPGELMDFMNLGFEAAEKAGVALWGVFGGHNNMFMSSAMERYGDVSRDALLTGSFMALTHVGEVFDESVTLGQDAELSLRFISKGYGAIRLNRFAITRYGREGFTPGGAYEFYRGGTRELDYRTTIERYSSLVKRAGNGPGFTIIKHEGNSGVFPHRVALTPGNPWEGVAP